MTTKAKKDFSQGKIYKKEPICDHEEGDIYIGSTTKKYLCQRMVQHRNQYKNWLLGKDDMTTSFKIFDKYGLNNCQIIVLENVNATNFNDLRAREAHFIKSLECVNKQIPTRTRRQYYEDNKDKIIELNKIYREEHKEEIKHMSKTYYNTNVEKIKEYQKQYTINNKELVKAQKQIYRENNKEYYLDYSKEYYEKNKDTLEEKYKEYRDNNKDKIKEWREQMFKCECGSKCRIGKKQRHFKTIKHLKFLESNEYLNANS